MSDFLATKDTEVKYHMDHVDEEKATFVDLVELELSKTDLVLIKEIEDKFHGLRVRYLPIDRGLSSSRKIVCKPSTLFPLIIKLDNKEKLLVEYKGDNLLRLRVPPLNLPPFFDFRSKRNRASLTYRYITGGRVKDVVDRLDIFLSKADVPDAINLIVEIFDIVMKKCHWMDGNFAISNIILPEISEPESSIEIEKWTEIKKLYKHVRSRARRIKAPHAITHGDLHSKNILVTRNKSPVLIDFSHAKANTCIYIDYAKFESNLQFQIPNIPADRFLKLYERIYSSSGQLIYPRSSLPFAEYVHKIRSILWKNCSSITAGLNPEEIDLGYRSYLIYFLMRFYSNTKNNKYNREIAFRELKNLAWPLLKNSKML